MLKVTPSMGWSQWRNNTTFEERYEEVLYWVEKELEDRATFSNEEFDIKIWLEFLKTKTIPNNYVQGVGLVCRVLQDLDVSMTFGFDARDEYRNRILVEEKE